MTTTIKQERARALSPPSSSSSSSASLETKTASYGGGTTGRMAMLESKTASTARGTGTSTSTSISSGGKLCCDKCDGNHATDSCPHYKKGRDKHPDAQKGKGRGLGDGTGGNFTLRSARVVKQPGDGSCLFHSIAYGAGGGTSARRLRQDIARYIGAHGSLEIASSPLSDWVRWESGCSVQAYARRMAVGGWGGGIEMAVASRLLGVNIHVYEKGQGGYSMMSSFSRSSYGTSRRGGGSGGGSGGGGGFKRISCFDVPGARKTVHVLYGGRVHYDALSV
eukprot:g3485.t1